MSLVLFCFFFFKQKTAYEMRISDWSSDVCSSDLQTARVDRSDVPGPARRTVRRVYHPPECRNRSQDAADRGRGARHPRPHRIAACRRQVHRQRSRAGRTCGRSEEHTSEPQSLMRISYAVFCLNKKKHIKTNTRNTLIMCTKKEDKK